MKSKRKVERKKGAAVRVQRVVRRRRPDLADQIAADIMHGHNRSHWPLRNQRIQFMAGKYPDGEIPQGGYCEQALADCIRRTLERTHSRLVKRGG